MSALDHRTSTDDPFVLADGTAVSVRPARLRDLDALGALAAHGGIVCDELELARLLRSDSTERLVLCATMREPGAAVDSVIGFGVIERHLVTTMPSLILVDPAHGAPFAAWLAEVLVERARIAAA